MKEKILDKRPIIIDCDTGTDDAIAIISALYSPELEVRALTTVAGNSTLENTSRNTINLVRHLGFDTPVAIGASEPILRKSHFLPEDYVHGETGLGELVLPDTKDPFLEKTAVEIIYSEALKCGGNLELIPIGPLTNIAHAICVYPDLKKLVKQIVFMGGAMYGGNATTSAEFNVWADPEAARIVFASGIPLTMVGLDVTEKAMLNREDEATIKSNHSKAAQVTAELLRFMLDRFDGGGEDALMHDALAVAVCIDPSVVELKEYFVDCECKGEYTSGHTFVAATNLFKKEPNCRVAVNLDLPKFKQWLHGTLKASEI